MIWLSDEEIYQENRQSSKGNQLKGCRRGKWYKADYLGYEGLAEYVISGLLRKSSLKEDAYIRYDTEKIGYGEVTFNGCVSNHFLKKGWQLITLERLFQNVYGESLNRLIYQIDDPKERLKFLTDQVIRVTGLEKFGNYIGQLLMIDTFFLNEDRHTHNLAVLLDEAGNYHYCPLFDHGGSLLSDTTMDYPVSGDVYELIEKAKPKTFCQNFDEQIDIAEELYHPKLEFYFREQDVQQLLNQESCYSQEIKERVFTILMWQRHRYQYLFRN